MKQKYMDKRFNTASLMVIGQANAIIEELQAQGYDLTLRQLYYQFVSRDLIPNTQKSYKRLGKIVSNGRLAGLIDWSAIVDRTRNVKANPHWSNIGEILYGCASQFRYDLWKDQPYQIEVWIEKEALIGVIQRPCNELDIPFFACRGYVSQSEQRYAGLRAFSRDNDGQQTVILHLGDHDPSGMDMTRDNVERLAMFSEFRQAVIVERIALNMDQVEQYNPPPNPAKLTDSRAKEYIARYGSSSWELDALEPRVIDTLIRDHVAKYINQDRMDAALERQREARATLTTLAEEYES